MLAFQIYRSICKQSCKRILLWQLWWICHCLETIKSHIKSKEIVNISLTRFTSWPKINNINILSQVESSVGYHGSAQLHCFEYKKNKITKTAENAHLSSCWLVSLVFEVVFCVDWLQPSKSSPSTWVLSHEKAAEISFVRHKLPLARSPGKDVLSLQLSCSLKERGEQDISAVFTFTPLPLQSSFIAAAFCPLNPLPGMTLNFVTVGQQSGAAPDPP